MRIKLATMRPDSWRKTASAAARAWMGGPAVTDFGRSGDRADLDAALPSFASGRNSPGPLDGFIQIAALENVVARELLLGFGERAIESDRSAFFHTDGGRERGRFQPLHRQQDALLPGFLHDGAVAVLDALDLLDRRTFRPFLRIDQKHVAHGGCP